MASQKEEKRVYFPLMVRTIGENRFYKFNARGFPTEMMGREVLVYGSKFVEFMGRSKEQQLELGFDLENACKTFETRIRTLLFGLTDRDFKIEWRSSSEDMYNAIESYDSMMLDFMIIRCFINKTAEPEYKEPYTSVFVLYDIWAYMQAYPFIKHILDEETAKKASK